MCHGFVRSLILVLLCLETLSFVIVSNTDGYVFISGKSQTSFPGKKIKYDSRIHDFMFDNSGFGGEWFSASSPTIWEQWGLQSTLVLLILLSSLR